MLEVLQKTISIVLLAVVLTMFLASCKAGNAGSVSAKNTSAQVDSSEETNSINNGESPMELGAEDDDSVENEADLTRGESTIGNEALEENAADDDSAEENAVVEEETPVACRRFYPGHYIRVADDGTRTPQVDGLAKLANTLNEDLHNFVGIVYQFMWGELESSEGVYDFTDLDQVRRQANTAGVKYLFKMQDRTFWTGCDSRFIPEYISKEGPRTGANKNFCTAKIWEEDVMDHHIRVLSAIADRYYDDPDFVGFGFEETAIAIDKENSGYSNEALIDELIRQSTSLHEHYPELILNQAVNWLPESELTRLATALADLEGGGSFGWPDSVPSNVDNWHWYAIGVEYNDRLVLMPSVQTAQIEASETQDIFNILVHNMRSHIVVWDTWHASTQGYLRDEVIATVDMNNGIIVNKTCPY